jgi:hypothetical protein
MSEWKYDNDKSEAENWADYTDFLDEQERVKAESYAEAGTLPPGVVNRNPDSTTPEANYVSRDNIVVSGASPAHIQAAVEALGDDERRRDALDAADVAQGATREDYEAAILAVAPGATLEQAEDAPQDVADVDEEPDGPKASGGHEAEGDEDRHDDEPDRTREA